MADKRPKKYVTVGFVALGCAKNLVDSERMLAEIVEAGLVISADADNADVVVVNTCSFIEPAKAEAIEAINHALERKQAGAVRKVVVAGCLPQRLGAKLLSQVPGIDAIVGLDQRDSIAEIIKQTLESESRSAYITQTPYQVHDDRSRLRITPAHWAYLRISEGCNHNCAFCTIPAIRGRLRSKPQELILAEAQELAAAGAVELNVIAQDVTAYGRDLKMKDGLAKLLGELEKTPTLKWIRLLYLYPTGITERLIETIAASEKIVRYLDIPIQHINNRILKQMARPNTKERIYRLIEKLRDTLDDIVLRTTLIVGLPGETEAEFAELLEFVKWARFDALGCFKYYAESGTPAAKMAGQVPKKVKQQRFEELMLRQQEIAFAKNKSRIGSELICLLDSVEAKGAGRARFYGQAPDIDSLCLVKNCLAAAGTFLNVKVVDTKDYDLVVEQI